MFVLIFSLLYLTLIIILPMLFIIFFIDPSIINRRKIPTRKNIFFYWVILSSINILLIFSLNKLMKHIYRDNVINENNIVNYSKNQNKPIKNKPIKNKPIKNKPISSIKWKFEEQIDKMTSNKIKFASIKACEKLYFDFQI